MKVASLLTPQIWLGILDHVSLFTHCYMLTKDRLSSFHMLYVSFMGIGLKDSLKGQTLTQNQGFILKNIAERG